MAKFWRKDDDLGLGSRVSPDRGERMVQRDGSFRVRRVGRGWRAVLGLYHRLLDMSWPAFLGVLLIGFLTVNVAFAIGYLACGPDALSGGPPGCDGFWQAFFFTVHTFTTVGYGNIVPVSMAANVLMVAESFFGMLGYALATGLIFARFSRPYADFRFSNCAIVAPYQDRSAVMFRVANRRNNLVVALHARVTLSMIERREDITKRRFVRLELERDEIQFFPLAWTLVHPIGRDSPVYGWTQEDWDQADAEIIVMLMGTDESTAQMVNARYSYKPGDVHCGRRFRDLFVRHEAGNPTAIDLSRLDDTEPADLP